MIVHFIAAESSVVKDIDTLRSIIKVLHGYGYSIARDWVEPAYQRRVKNVAYREVDWSRAYRESMEALAKAELVIAEVSHEGLSLGYQIANAVRQKKPTLLLREASANEDMFVTGIEEPHIFHETYANEEELRAIIAKFVEQNHVEVKDMRFNFFIDRRIHNYLRWASFATGKTKAEVVRQLLKNDIEKNNQL